MTSSHSGSPSKGMWTAQRTHIPCRGFPVKLRRHLRSLTRGAGVLLVGCLVLVGCQRPVAQSEGAGAGPDPGRAQAGAGGAAGVDRHPGGRGQGEGRAGGAAAGPDDGGARSRPGRLVRGRAPARGGWAGGDRGSRRLALWAGGVLPAWRAATRGPDRGRAGWGSGPVVCGEAGRAVGQGGPAGRAHLEPHSAACPAADHLRGELRPLLGPLPRQRHRLRARRQIDSVI